MAEIDQSQNSQALSNACIPSGYSRLIARVLNLNEQELHLLLNATGLTTQEFVKEDTLITPMQQVQILNNALTISEDEDFGLRLGSHLTPATHGAMGFLANSSPNLVTALKAFQTYSPTRISFARTELNLTEDFLECYYHIDLDLSPKAERLMHEAAAASFFACAEFIVGRKITEAVSYFAHPEPTYSDQYAEYFPGRFEFSHSDTFVRIPLAIAQIPNASANHENYLLAMRQCESMLKQLRSLQGSSKYHAEKMMLSHPPGTVSEEDLAAALFVSKRTLARRLKKEDTSYRQIRDSLLSQQASAYLSDSDMSVEAVAALLNYHDSSNFRRAFRRWFGVSPDQFRKQLKQN